MSISRQTIKPSPRRASSASRAGTPHTPRHTRLNAGQTRITTPIRTVQIRPITTRTTPTHTRRPQTHGAQTFAAHTHLMPPHTTGRRFSREDRRPSLQAHATDHHSGCSFYCYLCYGCYCCCLTLLSFSLLLLLSPPPRTTTPTASHSSSLIPVPVPVTPPPCLPSYPPPSPPSPPVYPFCPVLPCILPPHNSFPILHSCPSPYPLNLSCPLSPNSPVFPSTSSHRSPPPSFTATPSTPPHPPSSPLLHRPNLCRPRPSSSPRSLPSLLLCPPSFGDSVEALSSVSTLDPVPSAGPLARPRTLQQPLIHPPVPSLLTHHPPTSSQSLGQLHQVPPPGPGHPRGGGGGTQRGPIGVRGSLVGAGVSRCRGGGGRGGGGRGNLRSWDHMMGQLKNRGLDDMPFLDVGIKPGNSPKGHLPDGHSSVTDLANSLTGDMVKLSPGSEDDDGEGPISDKLGRIQFSVGYSFQDSTLTVKLLKGQELPAKDFSGTSDPFVKLYLLPDKKHKLETKVKRKNLNPHWNETFLFEGFPYEKVRERTLYLQVLDFDRFSRNDPIGEVSIPLYKLSDLGHKQTFWKELKPCMDGNGRRGDLLVSLCYNPTANTITVNIIKARNLKAMDIGGTSDPYVKLWLMHKDKRIEKKKTVTIKRCLNPVFNESFPFEVPAHVLRETTIIITVMDKDRLSRNDVIGKIYLSWKSGPAEVKHWKDMMGRPRTNVVQWHALKA